MNFDLIIQMREKSDKAFFIYNKIDCKVHYANTMALSLYEEHNEPIVLYDIFKLNNTQPYLLINIKKNLQLNGIAHLYDMTTTTKNGEHKLADIELGYLGDSYDFIYIELSHKIDKRMEMAMHQIDNSLHPEAILELDDQLTIHHCNQYFCDIFETTINGCHKHFLYKLGNTFLGDKKIELLEEIHEELKNKMTCYKELQIVTLLGEIKWYSLNLQRREIDDSGEKLMAYMSYIPDR